MDLAPDRARRLLRATLGERAYSRLRQAYRRRLGPHAYLRGVSGLIHVGAHTGQEREIYASFDLDVLWVEPLPEVFQELEANIAAHPKQHARQRLLTDVQGREYCFHVANNAGASSSILDLADHRRMWPEVAFERDLILESTTLDALLSQEKLDASRYPALVLDAQGSELLVLRGALETLPHLRFIQAEAADFEAYQGGCRAEDLTTFLAAQRFVEWRRRAQYTTPGIGTYYEMLFRRAPRS